MSASLLMDEKRFLEPEAFKSRVTSEWSQWTEPGWQAALARDLRQLGMEAELTDAAGRLIFRSEPVAAPRRAVPSALDRTDYDRRWAEVREVLHDGIPVGYARVAYRWNPVIVDRGVIWQVVWLSLGAVLRSVLLISGLGIWLLSRRLPSGRGRR